jgi:hypothetical protein
MTTLFPAVPSANSGDVGQAAGYDTSRLNAVRHGVLSRFTVLPWEDAAEHRELVHMLVAEHEPVGTTEMHLVTELAGVFWRKRRLRLAEGATFQRGLQAAVDNGCKTTRAALVTRSEFPTGAMDVKLAVRDGAKDPEQLLAEHEADQRMTLNAMEVLGSGRNSAYQDALDVLHVSTREAWIDQLAWEPTDYGEDVKPYSADSASLLRYLADEIIPWYDRERAEIIARPSVRTQALGEALDPDRLERLARYEVHLDRKFERTLSTLLRLQELRRAREVRPSTGG